MHILLSISIISFQGGVYLVNFLNVYGPGLAILFVVFVESAGVFWFYGVDNFSSDVEMMIGQRPGLYWRICWRYISPIFLLVIFIFSLLGYEDMLGEEYEYPEWSIFLGWALTLSSILCIPLYIVYKILITPGTITQVRDFFLYSRYSTYRKGFVLSMERLINGICSFFFWHFTASE